MVRRVDGGSGAKNKALADALTTETARIILCTLQTFSHVDASLAVGRRNHAVIVDEAHSSQTGQEAADLKGVLGAATEEERLAMAEKAETAEAGEPITGEDRIAEAVAARATQPNLSFFAFTATPKARTVDLFGTLDPAAPEVHVLQEPLTQAEGRRAGCGSPSRIATACSSRRWQDPERQEAPGRASGLHVDLARLQGLEPRTF